jgi:hypothetical protein
VVANPEDHLNLLEKVELGGERQIYRGLETKGKSQHAEEVDVLEKVSKRFNLFERKE